MCQSKQCKVEGCENKKKARGLCNKHYTRFSRYGTHKLLHEVVSVKGKPCEIIGCKETQKAKGLCDYHYFEEWKRKKTKVCSIDGCSSKEYTKGLCQNHYMRKRDEEIEKLEKLG
ncbi:hypothetical protein [Bacillus toyonensis]|uniref:hypothetical protein n=1 Tax=Bacillus toyonensis TaxID=155322 RepID=UPI000BF4C9E2|nr:hypothetical protein [Bacillus toyonensis]PGF05232.1 hypothetical protein COM61_02110 [Bacillus toyonensis]